MVVFSRINPSPSLARATDALTAGDRFDRLRPWSLPTATRKSVRVIAGFGPADGSTTEIIDNISVLIAAAKAAGKLDALAAEAKALADQKIENGRALSQ